MSLSFLTPWILAGSALIAVPIIVHLILRKQPKHLLFPAFRFLQLRHKTNLRKLRLRHFLLLAARVLLILLICAALARPELAGGPGELTAHAPINVLLVFDTSPSMEYESEGKTRLEESKERAIQFLQELPAGSQAAVLDTAESGAAFVSVRDAVKQVQNRRIRAHNRPVTKSLEEAYPVMDREIDAAKKEGRAVLPMVVCIFSDRTAASWSADSVAPLLMPAKKRLEEKLGDAVAGVYIDMSAPEPRNVAITSIKLKRGGGDVPIEALSYGSGGKQAQLQAVIQVTGTRVDGEVVLILEGDVKDKKRIQLEAKPGEVATGTVTFSAIPLDGDRHQGEVRLRNHDLLEADNVRYWTLVRPKWRVLTVADVESDAWSWCDALDALADAGQLPISCDLKTPKDMPRVLTPELYQVVCLMNVARPSDELWENLRQYVTAGGGVIILPGELGDQAAPASYRTDAALSIMPARLREKRADRNGVFLDPQDYNHPILAALKDLQISALDYWRATKFWELELSPDVGSVIVPYNVNALGSDREKAPALVERIFDPQRVRGRVLLFTTAMYRRNPTDEPSWRDWNNYHRGGWFYTALTWLTVRHALGAREERQNFTLDEEVRFWLPRGPGFREYQVSGPGRGIGAVEEGQALLLVREATLPGSYTAADSTGKTWQRFFSRNLSPLETQLVSQRPAAAAIEELLGEGSVHALNDELNVRDLARAGLGITPKAELLPYVMIGVLFLLAAENLLANRFYRREPETEE